MKHTELIKRDFEALRLAVTALVGFGEPYALLDFPDHSNVGDSAIWIGEEVLLRKITRSGPAFVSTADNLDDNALRAALPSGPIFLHGGGNFGNIYEKHQSFRERILRSFPERLIIQLPQSIKYRGDVGIDVTAQAIASHKNFHFFVRDHASLAFAREHFACPVTLVPDAAFAMGALSRPAPPHFDTLFMLREDVERVQHDFSPFEGIANTSRSDWIVEPAHFRRDIKREAAVKALLSGQWSSSQRRVVYYHLLASARLARGLALLGSARRVVTDRLHAHILCTLLDIPHVAMDNDYGKIHSYIDAWTAPYDGVRTALTPAAAIAEAKLLPA